jgi:hypothetical protein
MNFLPHESETIVISKDASQVCLALMHSTIAENIVRDRQEYTEKLFVGWVNEKEFLVSIRPKRPNSFLPTMSGQIESASTGSILFIKYELFRSTKLYLSFWSLFIVVAGLITFFQLSTIFVPIATIAVITFIHYIAWANFKMQVRISRDILLKSLEQ